MDDALLIMIKDRAREILQDPEVALGPRELASLTDAIIKVSKFEKELDDELKDLEKATSGLAVFPTMPAGVASLPPL